MDVSGRPQDPRRAGARILDTAEGVLLALRGCTLNQAFVEIVQTAKAHNVSTLSLADALVALSQDQTSQYRDDSAFVAARAAWGPLLDKVRSDRGGRFGRDDDDGVAGALERCDVDGLALLGSVGGGNVVGKRIVVEVNRHGFPLLLLVTGSSDRSRAFSDVR